ncbi:hypothetical protein [Bradyrhizobium sp.]|uniref:hypothetical protein n=1 Tax=Bradyrhizobium sp. TaxID=376 RepID=UPI0039E3B50F
MLIETVCLYDEIAVLGRKAYEMLRSLTDNSGVVAAINGIIRADDPTFDPQLVNATCGHLGAFLGEEADEERFLPLIENLFKPDWVERAFAVKTDDIADFKTGEEWVRTVPDDVDMRMELEKDVGSHRSTTFLLRTFLYLAYADVNHISLLPDETRASVLQPIVRSERQVRRQLLDRLDQAFQANYLGDEEVRRNITPLASVVFDRAGSNPDNIPDEMLRLRRELSSLRERLREVEKLLETGLRSDELQAIQKQDAILKEIERTHGTGEGLVSLESTLAFGEAVGKVVEKPANPATWFKPLTLPVDVIRRVFSRRSAVEIHRLQFPATSRLQAAALKLFGNLAKEPQLK